MFRYAPRLFALSLLSSGFAFAIGRAEEAPRDAAQQPDLPAGAVRRLGSAAFQGEEMARGASLIPGGKQLVTADKKNIIIWEVATGKRLAAVPLPSLLKASPKHPIAPGMLHFRFASNGKVLIALHGGTAYEYALPLEGEPVKLANPNLQEGIVEAVFGSGDRLFASTTSGRLVERKVARDGTSSWVDTGCPAVKGSNVFLAIGGTVAVLYGADNKAGPFGSATGGADNKLRLWDTASNKDLGTIDAPSVRALAVSADGKTIATLDPAAIPRQQNGVQLWSVAERKEIRSWLPTKPMTLVAFSPDGTKLAVGNGALVELYETKTGKLLHTLPDASGIGRALEFLPDGSTVIATGNLGVVRQWNVTTGAAVGPRHMGHTGPVQAVIATKDGGWVTGGDDGTARLWDKDGKEVRVFVGERVASSSAPTITALALSPDEKILFTASMDRTVRAWDVAKGTELRRYEAAPLTDGPMYCMALSPNGKALAVGVRDGVRIFDAESLKSITSLLPDSAEPIGIPMGWTNAVAFSDNDHVISRDSRNAIRVWDVAKKKEVRTLDAKRGDPNRVRMCVSPDGKWLASPVGAKEGTLPSADRLGIWELETGKLLYQIGVGQADNLTAVAFLPGGKAVAVGDATGRVWVIDLGEKTATARHAFKGHRGPVLSLTASADGKTLSSGGADTTVLVWKLDKP